MNKKRISLTMALGIMLLAVVTTAIIVCFATTEFCRRELVDPYEYGALFAKYHEMQYLVDTYFVGDYDDQELLDAMFAGYIDGLGDKWSGYYSAEQTEQIVQNNTNSYVGIGITFKQNEQDQYEITGLNTKGPALKAGFAIKDIIYKVNDTPASELETTDDVVAAVTGEEGTTVRITVLRGDEYIERELIRTKLFNECVEARMLEGDIGYVVITDFAKNGDVEFKEKVNALVEQGAKALIFDVRFNGGGYVSVMANMLDLLLPQGDIITMVDSAGIESKYRSDISCIDLPMAVLANEYSISAAEFFAAALQEYQVAKVIGDKTGGKGYAQSLFTLSDGSSVNISIYRYFTPTGKSLIGTGIAPDIEISLSDEDFVNFYYLTDEQDTQLQAAIEYVESLIK